MAEATRIVEGIEIPAVGTWEVDPAHSRLGFVARHLMVTKVRGSFDVFGGTIAVGERPEDSTVEVRVDTASITTGSRRPRHHLRSGDFLDVERFPEMTFRSTKVERNGDTGLRLRAS